MLFPFFDKAKCPKHPTYKGIKKPTANCDKCRAIFNYNEKLREKVREYNGEASPAS